MTKKATTKETKTVTPSRAIAEILWKSTENEFARMMLLLSIRRELSDTKGKIVSWTDIPGWEAFRRDKKFVIKFTINGITYDFLSLMKSMHFELKEAIEVEARWGMMALVNKFQHRIGKFGVEGIMKELEQPVKTVAASGGFTDQTPAGD